MNQRDAQELIDKYIDHSLTDTEAGVLRDWLNDSEDNLRFFADYMLIHTYTHQHFIAVDQVTSIDKYMESNGSIEGLVLHETEDILASLPELPDLPTAKKMKARSGAPRTDSTSTDSNEVARFGGMRVYRRTVEVDTGRRVRRFAAAAVVGVAALLTWWLTQPKHLATIADQDNAVWHNRGSTYARGDQLLPGRYGLTEGFAELRFEDGTSVVLESPIDFQLTERNSMTLFEGRLAAKASKTTDRFVVSTPTVHVIDVGTEFGVGVNSHGATQVAVFDGAVVMSDTPDPPVNHSNSLTIKANQQAGVNPEGILPKSPMPLDPTHPFTRSFAESRNQLLVEGAVRWHRIVPKDLTGGRHVYDDHMIVFRERVNADGGGEFIGLPASPGSYKGSVMRSTLRQVPRDLLVDSYLVRCRRSKTDRIDAVTMRGQITFPRPIVAVIVDSEDLYRSDLRYGNPQTTYLKPNNNEIVPGSRGLETTLGVDEYDMIEISEDRRTIKLEWFVVAIDQVRVLIESEQ